MIRLLVGLGNPGVQYEGTRHNAGFWWVEAAARKLGVTLAPQRSYFGLGVKAATASGPVWLLEPMTYMNLSGKSVAALARFFKIEPQQILVVHDELDLPPGTARFKLGGGHGGHNGLRDTITHCGADFWRLRIGIGHPGDRDQVIDYVLQRAAPADEEAIVSSIGAALEVLPTFLKDGAEKAMKQLHTQGSDR